MDCPRCRVKMPAVKAGEVELDVCRACEGVWFDKDELSRTLKSSEAVRSQGVQASWSGGPNAETEPGASALACPRCSGKMRRYRFGLSSAVLIDGCLKGCGVWLDDGELGRIAEHLTEHLRPATPGERETLAAHQAQFQAASAARDELFIDRLLRLSRYHEVANGVARLVREAYRSLGLP